MFDLDELRRRRLRNRRQDGDGRLENPEGAVSFIQRVGTATLYGASPEFPSPYQAHMGDPNPPSSPPGTRLADTSTRGVGRLAGPTPLAAALAELEARGAVQRASFGNNTYFVSTEENI